MKILIVYFQESNSNIRNTIDEHLHSFARYSEEDCYYINVAFGVPPYINKVDFDIVIYHYTVCVCRNFRSKFEKQLVKWQKLKNISGYKVAIPQDEYLNTDLLCRFFLEYSVKTVFTCLPEAEWEKAYPKKLSGVDNFVTVLTGYVDENSVEHISKCANGERDIDIGYRARKVPYYLGRHGCLKWQIADKFIAACSGSSLKIDISTNGNSDAYFGDGWYKFLCRCRTVIGCEGGSSLLDHDGQVRLLVEDYLRDNPNACYDEVEQACFPGIDGNLELSAVSPRHFECCMTKTCQVLVEGYYAGIFKPGVHYIEVKKDWSNLSEVINQINDHDFCKQIAENAYRDIIESGRYTYKIFVKTVIENSLRYIQVTSSNGPYCVDIFKKIELREGNAHIYRIPYRLKYLIHSALKLVGLFEKYKQTRERGLWKSLISYVAG